jgi:hypothetical protein
MLAIGAGCVGSGQDESLTRGVLEPRTYAPDVCDQGDLVPPEPGQGMVGYEGRSDGYGIHGCLSGCEASYDVVPVSRRFDEGCNFLSWRIVPSLTSVRLLRMRITSPGFVPAVYLKSVQNGPSTGRWVRPGEGLTPVAGAPGSYDLTVLRPRGAALYVFVTSVGVANGEERTVGAGRQATLELLSLDDLLRPVCGLAIAGDIQSGSVADLFDGRPETAVDVDYRTLGRLSVTLGSCQTGEARTMLVYDVEADTRGDHITEWVGYEGPANTYGAAYVPENRRYPAILQAFADRIVLQFGAVAPFFFDNDSVVSSLRIRGYDPVEIRARFPVIELPDASR